MSLPSRSLCVDVSRTGQVVLARLNSPHFDESNARAIDDGLFGLADESDPSELRVDLGRVRYVSSMALAVLVRLHKRVVAGGGRVVLVGLRPHVREVFEVTRLTGVFVVEGAHRLPA